MDELELWEIAAILGVNDPEADETPGSGVRRNGRGLTPEEQNRQRIRDLERSRPAWMDAEGALTPDEETFLQQQAQARMAVAGGGGD